MQEETVFNTWNKTRHTKNLKHEQQPEWSRTIQRCLICADTIICITDTMSYKRLIVCKPEGEKVTCQTEKS